MKIQRLMFLFCALWCWTVSGGEAQQAEAMKIARAPVLDGKLDEAFWREAKPLGDFHVYGKDKTAKDTEVKIAYDSAWLYLGVKCRNEKPGLLKLKALHHDSGVNSDDSVELFIDPGSDGKTYFHFLLNEGNIKADQRVIDKRRDRAWNPPWRSATMKTDDGWTAEMAIPLSVPASYGDIGKLRINICRNKRVPLLDTCGVVVNEIMELSSWAPAANGFHDPDSFKSLTLEKNTGITFPFMATFGVDNIGRYYVTNSQSYFDVIVSLRGMSSTTGEVDMILADRPIHGQEKRIVENVKIESAQPQQLVIKVPVDSFCRRTLGLELKDKKSGELFQQENISELPGLDIMSVYFDRNYYTTEENAALYYAIAMAPDSLSGMSLRIKNEKSGIICEETNILSGLPLVIPIKGLAEGEHALRLELSSPKGEPYFDADCRLIKRKPEPGGEWKIDKVNRVVLNNGKPFFPFGIVVHKIKPDEADKFKDLADTGFNSFLCWQESNPEDVPALCKTAAAHGLFFMPIIDDMMASGYPVDLETMGKYFRGAELEKLKKQYGKCSLTSAKGIGLEPPFLSLSVDQRTEIYADKYRQALPRIIEGIEGAKKHPATAAYFIMDEPLSDVSFRQAEIGREVYNEIIKADGYHPVMVNYSSDIWDGDQYVAFMDILMTDPYWIPGVQDASGRRGSINWVSKIVTETDRRAAKFRQAVWIVPMAEYWSGCRKRIITGPEQICQTFLALINGAKGLLYFCYPIKSVENQEAFKLLAKQIKEMEQALLAPSVRHEIQYYDAKIVSGKETAPEKAVFAPANDKFTDIQARLFKYPGGDYLLLAANCRAYPVDTEFRINGRTGKARRLFGENSVKIKDNIYRDKLEAFGTRAYVFNLDNDVRRVDIEIKMAHPGEEVTPQEISFEYGRPGKRNVQPNPSFEETSISNWPDYYLPRGRHDVSRPVGSPQAKWGTDQAEAKFGRASLKMITMTNENNTCVYWFCAPQNDEPAPYTLSCWLKGGETGLRVNVRAWETGSTTRGSQTFTINKEWNRYHINFTMPPKVEKYQMYDIQMQSAGTIWVDGIQLEKGTQPTEFEE